MTRYEDLPKLTYDLDKLSTWSKLEIKSFALPEGLFWRIRRIPFNHVFLLELRRKTKLGSWCTADEVLLNGTEEHILETADRVFKKWAGSPANNE